MGKRSANEAILGYFYQFDYSILEILNLQNDTNVITIEGVEDIDVNLNDETLAIQCKYYSESDYNHSLIGKPIRLMLNDFKKNKRDENFKYKLYGHYKSGQNKLKHPINIIYFKENFLTYTEKGSKKEHYNEIDITDYELKIFLKNLTIDINALSFSEQRKKILDLITICFKCKNDDEKNNFYSNALALISDLAIKKDEQDRKITKKIFLDKINKKIVLFNSWLKEYKGKNIFYKKIKYDYFIQDLNTSPYDRFFLFEIDNNNFDLSKLKTLILLVQKKWSKISKREPEPFCPYIYIHGICKNNLISLKKNLWNENHIFIDGFDYQDSEFNAYSIIKKPTEENNIKFKLINDLIHIESILKESNNTKEIYQFYLNKIIYNNHNNTMKNISIIIENIDDAMEILK